jgi:VanZ family protein
LLKPTLQNLAKNWWPALLWLGIIRLESTDMASSTHTSNLLYSIIALVYPRVSGLVIQETNEILRKSGHFIGYGILGALVFLALKNTNRDRLRPLLQRPWGTYLRDLWRLEWAVVGILVALITASFDEIHQTFMPSRTGRWQDVVIDTCGALVLQLIIYLLSLRAFGRRREQVQQPEFSSTR